MNDLKRIAREYKALADLILTIKGTGLETDAVVMEQLRMLEASVIDYNAQLEKLFVLGSLRTVPLKRSPPNLVLVKR